MCTAALDCIPDIIKQIPSRVTLPFIRWICTDAQNVQRDRVSHCRAKGPSPRPLSMPSINASYFLVTRLTCANDVSVAAGTVWTRASEALACSHSLNSPRSNLQTAAEFWQILPRCLLPLGDTFFIYFSSPPLWYSLHGALAPQAIVSSVLHPCLKDQMDLQGLLSTPPFFWPYECGTVLYFLCFISTLPVVLWWLDLSSLNPALVAL